MLMESTRRSFDRSISKEPGLKKPRLAEDHAAPHRSSGDRSGFIQRPVLSNAGGGSRARRDGDSESGDPVRGSYQHQPGGQLQQELVNRYRVALSELTFNSKPIITNLTIIAGENLHSAKAIAATVCSNILEVPREQKLPSLYLLDSIVKNIGRDYIKCFATKLPEVFCKAYRLVDPSIHQGMRHLFGTWKGVFPPHILQMIEKELGFTAAANGSSSGLTSSRPDSQAQHPPHSIHVNPKYLEARQRFQFTKARGSGDDTSGSLVSPHEDVEAPGRPISISSDRLSADPSAKPIHHHYKDKVSEAVRHKSSSAPYLDPQYGSSVSGSIGLGTGRVSPKFKEQGLDQSWHESGGSNAKGKLFNKRDNLHLEHGFVERAATLQPGSSNLYPLLKPNFSSKAPNGVSRSWENDEEEEYMWDGMNSRSNDCDAVVTAAKDSLTSYVYEKLGLENQFQRSQGMLDTGPSVPDEAPTDSLSGTQIQLSSSKELYPSEAMLLGLGHNLPGYSQGNSRELKNIANTVTRKPFQSQQNPAPIGGQTHKFSTDAVSVPKGSIKQLSLGTTSTQSGLHQHPPSPSLSAHNQGKLLSNHAEENQTSTGLPKDPRRPPRKKNVGSHDVSSKGSLPLSSIDAYEPSMQKFKPQSVQALHATIHAVKQRKHFPSTQPGKLEESSDVDRLLKAEISGSGSQSVRAKSLSDQSNPLTIDSTGQPVSSNLLTAAVKSGRLGSTSLTGGSSISGIQGDGLGLSQLGAQPSFPIVSAPSPQSSLGNMMLPGFSRTKSKQAPLPPISSPSSLGGTGSKQATNAVEPTSDPVSSLLSSLVAKGLIAASKSDSSSAAATQKSDGSLGRLPSISSTRAAPASSVPVSTGKQLLLNTDESSMTDPSATASDDLLNSSRKIKNLIGFEFKSDVICTLHSDVLSDLLSDLPYQCNICGLRLKLQEPFDRHMEWHTLGISETNSFNKKSRTWYANIVEWVNGVGYFAAADSISDLFTGSDVTLESCEHMVPADERQCACLCCGELFVEFYSQERNGWMFKEAIYLSIPSSGACENSGSASNDPSCLSGPIVHVECMSEDFVQDMGLASDVELKDA